MPAYERISVVVSVTLFGLALYFVLDFPAQTTGITLLGSPIHLVSPRQWLMVALLGCLTMAGMDSIVRAHPNLPSRRLDYIATFWTLPGLLVVLATQTLGLATTPSIWVLTIFAVGVLLWFTIVAELYQISPAHRARFWARAWRQFVGYVIALAFYIVIYHTRTRSAISATAIMLVSGGVALSLLRQSPQEIFKTWLFAVVIGLSLGQLTWALNYWRTGALNAGLLLFLAFYVLIGLAQQHLQSRLSPRTLWEFGVVSTVAIIVIYNL